MPTDRGIRKTTLRVIRQSVDYNPQAKTADVIMQVIEDKSEACGSGASTNKARKGELTQRKICKRRRVLGLRRRAPNGNNKRKSGERS